MHTFEQLLAKVNQTIESEKFVKNPELLYLPIDYTMHLGGKRIRPVLTLAACEMFGEDIEHALYPAIGVEIFHNFTLLHDDIMDQAPIRRGKPTVYKKWNTNIAILSGDAMFALAYEYLTQTHPLKVQGVIQAFNKVAIGVCEGQQYDMDFETMPTVGIDEYIEMIRLKTSVLLGGALQVGAIIANASHHDLEHLYAFGENIGLAFQLQDDFLDVYADVDTFGKVNGGDIATNKKTFLLLSALKEAEKTATEDFNQLKYYFSSTDFDQQEKFNAVKTIYDRLKIPEITKHKMESFHQKALSHLAQITVEDNRKQTLQAIADNLMQRLY